MNYTIVSENEIKIGSLVTEIQNFGKDVCFLYYDLRVSEANEVPISSHIWVGLSTLNRL